MALVSYPLIRFVNVPLHTVCHLLHDEALYQKIIRHITYITITVLFNWNDVKIRRSINNNRSCQIWGGWLCCFVKKKIVQKELKINSLFSYVLE